MDPQNITVFALSNARAGEHNHALHIIETAASCGIGNDFYITICHYSDQKWPETTVGPNNICIQ